MWACDHETVEKRIQLDVDACKVIIEGMNPRPKGKILLELILAEQANALRTNLKNQILWLNNGLLGSKGVAED